MNNIITNVLTTNALTLRHLACDSRLFISDLVLDRLTCRGRPRVQGGHGKTVSYPEIELVLSLSEVLSATVLPPIVALFHDVHIGHWLLVFTDQHPPIACEGLLSSLHVGWIPEGVQLTMSLRATS